MSFELDTKEKVTHSALKPPVSTYDFRRKFSQKIAAILVAPFTTVLKRYENNESDISSILGFISMEVHRLLENKLYKQKWKNLRDFHLQLEESMSIEELVNTTFTKLPLIFPIQEVSILLTDKEGKSTVFVQTNGTTEKNTVQSMNISQDRILKYLNEKTTDNALKLPIMYQNQMIGILHVQGKRFMPLSTSNEEDMNMLAEIAEHLGILVNNIKHRIELSDLNDQLTKANEELQRLRITDPMGIYNKIYFEEKIKDRVHDIIRNPDRTFSLLFIDLNDFKLINDSKGHLVGDELLMQISQIFKKNIRDVDLAFRWGGDEFVILVMGKEEAAQEVLSRIAPHLIELGISWSTGICEVTNEKNIQLRTADSIASVIAQIKSLADKHMYIAKNEHKEKRKNDPLYDQSHNCSTTNLDIFDMIQQERKERNE